MVLSFLKGAALVFVVVGLLIAGRGATTDFVSDDEIVLAESL